MNEQNRKAKRVSQLSDSLYVKYYILYNQPQLHEAIITAIHTNGISVCVPFFDVTLSILFSNAAGVPEPWVQELYNKHSLLIT